MYIGCNWLQYPLEDEIYPRLRTIALNAEADAHLSVALLCCFRCNWWRNLAVVNCILLLQLTASPWTTEASTRETWQFGALTNRNTTSRNRDPSLTSLYYYLVALSLYRDKWTMIIPLWWLSQWLFTHGHHLAVTIFYMWRHLPTVTLHSLVLTLFTLQMGIALVIVVA